MPAEGAPLPEPGETVTAALDWQRRHRHMRIHTGLHLLSVVLPYPVTGGSIGADEGRLDFDIEGEVPAKEEIEEKLNALVAGRYPVSDEWITDEELLANPGLVKTMKVKPPMGTGRVRLVRIGDIDLQPCGGTHVRSTAEIGRLVIGKIEKQGPAEPARPHPLRGGLKAPTGSQTGSSRPNGSRPTCRRSRCRRGRRQLAPADAGRSRRKEYLDAPHSGRGVLRHRRHRRHVEPPAAHAPVGGGLCRGRRRARHRREADDRRLRRGRALLGAARLVDLPDHGREGRRHPRRRLPEMAGRERPVESGPVSAAAAETSMRASTQTPCAISTRSASGLAGGAMQVVDARPAARFRGEAPEPRAWVKSGHIPGSFSLPSTEIDRRRQLKDPAAIRAAFEAAGVDLEKPIVTSCGSGVNAATLTLALDMIGVPTALRRFVDRMGRTRRRADRNRAGGKRSAVGNWR